MQEIVDEREEGNSKDVVVFYLFLFKIGKHYLILGINGLVFFAPQRVLLNLIDI